MNSSRARILLRRTGVILLCAWALALAGCSDNEPKPAPKTNEFETGRFAMQKMFLAARLWAADAQPVNLSATATSESNGAEGKSGSWRAVFASPSKQKSQPFMWSGMADAAQPIDHGVEDTYNPNNRSMQIWDPNRLKIDTDQAFSVAQQHGGKQLLEKDPKTGVSYLLDFDPLSHKLRWHVMYASSSSSVRLSVVVDASSGDFMRKE